MLAALFEWWLRQIRSLPQPWLRRPGGQPDAVIVAVEDLRLEPELALTGTLLVRGQDREAPVTAYRLPHPPPLPPLPALRTGLRLPAGMVLRREVALPAGAARDLNAMLAFEMDRLTPFDADELLWSSGPARLTANRQTITFSLLLVLRRPVEALLAALDQAGLRPTFVECGDGRIELRRQAAPLHQRRRALWVLCGALTLACLIAPVLRQQRALDGAARQIAALQPALSEAQTLRQRFAAATAAQAAIAAARQNGDALRGLAALTAALPDGTWLSDLTLNSGSLTINGQSSDAAALIAVLAATPAIHDPRFAAPVIRAPGGGDVFSISATVTP